MAPKRRQTRKERMTLSNLGYKRKRNREGGQGTTLSPPNKKNNSAAGASSRKIKKTSIAENTPKEYEDITCLIRRQMKKRFQKCHIHVESHNDYTSSVRVWYQPRNEDYLQKKFEYEMETEVAGLSQVMPELHLSKWKNPPEKKQAYLDFAYTEIDTATQTLQFTHEKVWSNADMISDDSDDSASSSDSDASDSSRVLHSDENETSVNRSATQPTPAERLRAPLEIMGISYEQAVVQGFRDNVNAAFVDDMHNSVGREGVKAILGYACKIAFGWNCLENGTTRINQVGHSDGFPVDVVDLQEVEEGKDILWRSVLRRCHSRSSTSSRSDSSSPHDFPSCDRSGSVSPVVPGKRTSPLPLKYPQVYSDLAVTTVDGDWAKFLMLCELKCGFRSFTHKEHVQLMHQMIAACMHQTEVFGLLINSASAKLLWLQHSPEEKTLLCYDLLRDLRWFRNTEKESFRTQDLKSLLFDLIVVLDYAKKKISKIKPLKTRSN